MSLEQTLERIAVALEKIAQVKTAEFGGNQPVVPEVPLDTLEERARIKAELERLGVPFNNKARTEVLAKLLEDTKLAGEKKPEVAAAASQAPVLPPQAPAASPSSDTVREAVKKYAAIHGATKAVALLAKYKATKVSDLALTDYDAIIRDIDTEMR